MDRWQTERQLAYLLSTVTWADSPAAVVLTGGSAVSLDPASSYVQSGPNGSAPPFALVRGADESPDASTPARSSESRVSVTVVALGKTRVHGSTAGMIGSQRASSSPQGKSEGRGVSEVVGRIREVLGQLVDSTHGLAGVLSVVGREGPAADDPESQLVQIELVWTIYGAGASRVYHAPRRFKGTAPGGGQAALTWSLPPARFDTITTLVLRRASGSTPPATVSDGTNVALTAGVTSKTDTPGAGTFSYSLFQPLDETSGLTGSSPTTADRYSAAATVSGLAVS